MAQIVKNLPAMQETQIRPLGQEDPLEKENSNPLQYYAMDRGAWQVTVRGVTMSRTQLSN